MNRELGKEDMQGRKGKSKMMLRVSKEPDKKYLACIRRFPLKPIRSDKENELAAQVCDELLDNMDLLSRAERDYLEVLSKLVEDYESRWREEEDIEPRELLAFLIEQNGLSQIDLMPEFGTSSRASEFLSGKRPLSLPQILKLAKRFKLSPTAFISTDAIA
jgi:HTH-type transcriptional regulator/antitoxin HigA